MPGAVALMVLIGAVLVGVGILVLHNHLESKRTTELRAIAQTLGLEFSADGDPATADQLSLLPLFKVGRRKKIRNMLFGDTDELRLAIFDYQYTTGSGKHQHTSKQTVVAFQGPSLSLPQFELKPEHLFHKLGAVMGLTDINFETHPKFSKMYHLKGSNETGVRALFQSEALALLEGRPGLYLQGQGQTVVYFRSRHRAKPDQYKQLMSEAFQFYELWGSSDA